MTPALVFCFNRDECWTVAEQIKGKKVLSDGQQARLVEELDQHDWSQGAGTKLRQLLLRGVGVHHAGLLPKYRRIVEDALPAQAAERGHLHGDAGGGHQPAGPLGRAADILKGPPDKKRMIEPSAAHQIFGRAGRPQFDTHGHVYVLAHEDDVKIARWHEQYDKIPEDTKDPGLLRAKKALKRKMPHRRDNEQYWNEAQFQKLVAAPPGKLYSRGPLPWRLLGYMLDASPEIDIIRRLVGKRLMDSGPSGSGPARPGADAAGAAQGRLRAAGTGAAGSREREAESRERSGAGGNARTEPRSWHRAMAARRPPLPCSKSPVSPLSASRLPAPCSPPPRRPTAPCWPIRRRNCRSWRCSAASIRCSACSW